MLDIVKLNILKINIKNSCVMFNQNSEKGKKIKQKKFDPKGWP